MGSRGSEQSFGVEGGKLYVETTEMMKQGGESNFKVRAYYDGRGRLVKVTRPGVQGQGSVEESWVYDDANRSVTHNPVPGGSAEAVTTTTSADGKTTTITKGGTPYLRIERGTSGGSVTETTTLLSGNIPIKKVEINPSLGKQTITPMGWSGNAITMTESVAKTTYQNNLTGDSLTMNRASGLLTGITGTLNGVPLNMSNVDHDHGELRGISGTIGGAASGFSLDAAQRMTGLWGAGFSKGISYSAPGGGYKMSIQDSVQGTGFEMVVDAVADPVSVAGDGIQAMQFSVGDTATGRETAVNGSVTMQSNFYGDVNRKDYTGGISEVYGRDPDGSVNRVDVGGPQGLATSAIVEINTPQRKVINYGGGHTVDEQFYIFGSRQSVTAPNDNRTFAYDRFKPRTEVHGAGDLWNGAKVEWIPDASGRPGRLSVTGPGFGRIFDLQYFGGDRLSSTTTTGAKAVYTSNTTTGRLGTLTRGNLVTTWDYDEQTGLLKSVSNAGGAGLSLNYDYWPYGSKQRLKQRTASSGVSWANMAYDGNGGLTKADTNGSRTFEYAYDGRGNRIGAQGTSGATYSANGLDQLTGRSLASRGFGIYGTVDPATQLQITHPYLPSSGPAFSFNSATGEFSGFYTVPPTANNGGPLAVEALVKGTLPGVSGGADVVAEEKLRLMVPPVAETLLHDGAGRLEEDAWWNYTWDGAGRLRTMVRKPGAYPLANQTGERIDFVYDADGRRIQKTHTTTLTVNGQAQVSIEESNVLWSNWLPVLEIRKKNGQTLGRRWFQWGADLSGTMEGSGGIGGLIAILEEGPGGQLLRTLLPVQDGLGNITAVINAANGDTVASYDFGPYGEPLGERGEADACPFRWQTKWYDTESQHYYFGYRNYDPKHGRWLSRDPMGEAGGFNLYAYCGNDPVNQHDYLGMEPLSNCAPTNEAILARICAITAEIPHNAEIARLKAWKLRSSGSFAEQARLPAPYRPGATEAQRNEIAFLKNVLAARKELGANGYGTWQTSNVLNRHFGDINEDVLRYFTPQSGYATTPNMRANFRLMGNVAVGMVAASTGFIGVEEFALTGVLSVGRNTATSAGKIVEAGERGAFGAPELGEAIARDGFATKAYGRIQQAGFDVRLISESSDLAGETFNTGIVELNLMNTPTIREALGVVVHESKHVDLFVNTGRLYGTRGVGEYMARAREFLFLNGRRPNAEESADLIKKILDLGYEHR